MFILSDRVLRWLAWSITVLVIVLMYAGIALQIVTESPFYGAPMLIHFSETFTITVQITIGALIVSRHPRHPVGWLWILIGTSFGLDHFAWGYASYGYIAHPGSLPGMGAMFLWIYSFGRGTLGVLGIVLLVLLFPTGKPLSRRWGLVGWVALGAVAVMIPFSSVAPPTIGSFPFPTDPLAVGESVQGVLSPLGAIALIVTGLCLVAATASLFIRFRRSRGVERQQLKWYVYSMALLPIALILIAVSGSLAGPGANWGFLLGASFGILFGIGNAIASAIAIFRYRLWDIDIIINRTLVYGGLTATLALVYYLSVVLLTQIFGALTGRENSPVAIVISTLVIAALFTPLRRRIQRDIDRRFYRRKYDAQQIADDFSAGLREEVDIEQLNDRLLVVVEETLQPESLSLWLK